MGRDSFIKESFMKESLMKEVTEKVNVPVCEKAFLTIEAAAVYTNIGRTKLREISDEVGCEITIYVGAKRLLKREPLLRYLYGKEAV